MIIFDLDGTLADCEHRRHFIDPEKDLNLRIVEWNDGYIVHTIDNPKFYKWKPDWKSFYEACDKDKVIQPVIDMFFRLLEEQKEDIEIWSGRCESVEEKTNRWIKEKIDQQFGITPHFQWVYNIIMRPIGDYTPDDQLKESWLEETIREKRTVDFVFDANQESIRMWRRRGIFVFNCNQSGKEF